MYVMDNQVKWEEYLHLVEFAYNNGHHSSLGMPPYQALYGRPCRTPLSWNRIEEKVAVGPQIVKEMEQQVILIRQHLREAQDQQKKYANSHRTDQVFMVGDRVFLRVCPHKSPIYF